MSGENDDEDDDWDPEAPVVMPLTDTLDLHHFRPAEVADVVAEWLTACVEARFSQVRVIHGKGKGTLQRVVHATLGRHPGVASFVLAPPEAGGWGATLVVLKVIS